MTRIPRFRWSREGLGRQPYVNIINIGLISRAKSAQEQASFSQYFQAPTKGVTRIYIRAPASAACPLCMGAGSDALASSRSERNIVVHIAVAGACRDRAARRGAGGAAGPEIAAGFIGPEIATSATAA